jgi:glycine/D-amino acid oxidase-like deaminating enzyme
MLTAEPKAYGSNWYAATRVESPARGRLTVELDADVCIIGAGLAGLTTAREVARRGWSVVVLEAQSIAWSASGRSTGVVLPGFTLGADALIERVGLEQAKALWARSEAGAEYVRNAARDMPGAALSENGWLHVSRTDHTRAMAHEAALMAGEFGAAVEQWPADRVREALHSPYYFHGLHYLRGFCLHPLNYALGLAAAAEASGARIFEDTPVLEIDPAGVRKRVITQHSRLRATHVVLAGNVHLTDLFPQFANTLLPIFGTTVITAPLGDELHDAIRYSGAVACTGFAGPHHRVVEGDRLMWSGQSAVRLGKPQRHAEALVRQIRRTYPALRDVRAASAWIGVAGHTVHGMPQIGEVMPGLWLLGGFGGHGLNTTAMGGEIVARAIVEGDRSWQMFSPFALVWAGGAFGRAAQRVSEWSRRSGEMLGGLLARRREAKRRRQAKRHRVQASKVTVAAPVVVKPEAPPPLPADPIVVVEAAPGPIEPAPAAVAEPIAPAPSEGPSDGAVAPLPEVARTAEPAQRKPKRGKRRKGPGGMPPS